MSYERVRSITVREGRVYWRAFSNNCFPKDYSARECVGLTHVLRNEGKAGLDLAILKHYENGTFQGGRNRWSRAIERLKESPEYAQYDWRRSSFNADDPIEIARESGDFDRLLLSAFEAA